ncbi:MAG TPA: hypothetical protein EYH34_16045 [Planctomycetes bacterium]|nr:hypothetical protein [Planctomycetota bacterium]
MWNLDPPADFQGLRPDLPLTVYYRHLPHWRQQGATYFVTFHLDDALPEPKIRELQTIRRQWQAKHPPPRTKAEWEAYAREVTVKAERWLDQGHGRCYFAKPDHAQLLANSLLYFQDQRYRVFCYTVMPNHCHVLVRPLGRHKLEAILGSWKGYVAHQINRAYNRKGALWQQESYDRIVRDEEHLYRIIQYIGHNAARARIERSRWVRWIHPQWEQAGWRFVDEQ